MEERILPYEGIRVPNVILQVEDFNRLNSISENDYHYRDQNSCAKGCLLILSCLDNPQTQVRSKCILRLLTDSFPVLLNCSKITSP